MANFRPGLSDVERADLERWQQAAREIVDALQFVLREPSLDLSPTSPDRFPHFEPRWYAEQTQALEALGFTRLRDVDGGPLVPSNTHGGLIRVFRSPDGRSSAAIYVVKPKSPGFFTRFLLELLRRYPKTQRVLEFMSHRDDGVVLTTTGQSQFEVVPGSVRAVVTGTPGDVWARHQAQLETAGLVKTFDSMEQLGALREAQRLRQRRWRDEVGLLEKELDALLAPYGENGRRVRPHVEAELKRRARG
jgi:hypothetical protein